MIIAETPLRLSFNGGGTDFEGFYKDHSGAVISTAIDKSVYVVVKERFDDKIYLNWSKKEIVNDIDDIEHELIREAMRMTGVRRGIEITTLSDVPAEGSGLGSSSSITVALLHALHSYQNRLVTAEELAQQACEIEIDILKKPIGKQDQYIAAYGGMKFISFSSSGIKVSDSTLSTGLRTSLNEHLLLFYVGNTRSANKILEKQKSNIGINIAILEEKTRLAYRTREALELENLGLFGELLDLSWELKKRLNPDTTNSTIDDIYCQAKEAGAVGGKVVGAGGGGFILLYCPIQARNAVRVKLRHLQELPFRFNNKGSRIIFGYGG